MRPLELIDYELPLSTGEVISVSELDPEMVPAICDPDVLSALEPVLARCTYAPREIIEEAKIGGTDRLEALLSSPPVGCLLKLERPICGELETCAISNPAKCTTRNLRRGRPDFPLCWTIRLVPGGKESASYIADSIVDAWRCGRYVIVVGHRNMA